MQVDGGVKKQVYGVQSSFWIPLPQEFLALQALRPNVLHTFMCLCSFAGGSRYACWPSVDVITKRSPFSRRTVETHLDILDSLHIIKRIRRPHATSYYIICHKLKPNFQEAIRETLAQLPRHAHAKLTMKEWRIIIKAEKIRKRISARESQRMYGQTRGVA